MTINLTAVQTKKIRSKLASLGKAANKQFRLDNPDYTDKAYDFDDLEVLKGLGVETGMRCRDIRGVQPQLADLRSRYLVAGRDLFTLDRLTTTTEQDISDDQKFVLKPWVFVKQSRSEEIMYQQPKTETPDLNSLLDCSGREHQVLRSKRIFQLASDEEIDEFCSGVEVTLDLFLQLN